MLIAVKVEMDGEAVGVMQLNPKVFKTGSTGFYANGKVMIDNKKYQAQFQLVEVGSKPKDQEEDWDKNNI